MPLIDVARTPTIPPRLAISTRSAPLHAPSPCSACASPRRTRTAVRLIAALPLQSYAALIAHAAPRRKFALSSPAHIPASRHIILPYFVGICYNIRSFNRNRATAIGVSTESPMSSARMNQKRKSRKPSRRGSYEKLN